MSTIKDAASATLALVEETATVKLNDVVTGRVRITTRTETFSETAAASLETTEAKVTRVPINRYLDAGAPLPQPRTTGSLTVVPVFEEVLVVETRILLREEIHIALQTTTQDVSVPVSLRRQKADLERTIESAPPDHQSPNSSQE